MSYVRIIWNNYCLIHALQGRTSNLLGLPWRWGLHNPPKCMYLYTKLHGIIFRKTETVIGTVQESQCIFCWLYVISSTSVSGRLHHYHSNADCIVTYPPLMTVYFLTIAFQSKNQMPLKSRYWHSCGIITDVTIGNIYQSGYKNMECESVINNKIQ